MSEFRWGSGSPGTSGWSRIWVFFTSASPCSFAALILNATRSDPYLRVSSDTVSHRRAPRLRCVFVDLISLKKVDSVQCPSHWSHCSYRTDNLDEPRYGRWHTHTHTHLMILIKRQYMRACAELKLEGWCYHPCHVIWMQWIYHHVHAHYDLPEKRMMFFTILRKLSSHLRTWIPTTLEMHVMAEQHLFALAPACRISGGDPESKRIWRQPCCKLSPSMYKRNTVVFLRVPANHL